MNVIPVPNVGAQIMRQASASTAAGQTTAPALPQQKAEPQTRPPTPALGADDEIAKKFDEAPGVALRDLVLRIFREEASADQNTFRTNRQLATRFILRRLLDATPARRQQGFMALMAFATHADIL